MPVGKTGQRPDSVKERTKMANMTMTKTPMPEQEPNVRNHNFQEVALGYTKEEIERPLVGIVSSRMLVSGRKNKSRL